MRGREVVGNTERGSSLRVAVMGRGCLSWEKRGRLGGQKCLFLSKFTVKCIE
jgi:hypothetical protein